MKYNPKLNTDISMYLVLSTGQCLYGHHLGKKPTIDDQLIGGLFDALQLFIGEFKILDDKIKTLDIQANKTTQMRSIKYNKLTGINVFKDEIGYDDKIYNQLDDLLKGLVLRFNRDYHEKIELFQSKGKNEFSEIKDFMDNEVIRMKKEMQTTYLQAIVAEMIYQTSDRTLNKLMNDIQRANTILTSYAEKTKVDYTKLDECYTLIRLIDENVIAKLEKTDPKIFEIVVKKVNEMEQKDMWELFKVPFIKVFNE